MAALSDYNMLMIDQYFILHILHHTADIRIATDRYVLSKDLDLVGACLTRSWVVFRSEAPRH